MYDLPETPKEIHRAFGRTSTGKADEKDFEILGKHIQDKKKAIRDAKAGLGLEGASICQGKESDILVDVMWILDGGRR
tara:strand:- start:437 stop:670 length:234 start_codon:yes stop_codon:yes gene_type:complete